MTIPLRVLGDRVLIRPDVDSYAPETHRSGVLVAKSLAAAVTGRDPTPSSCRGTVLAVGQPKHPLADEAAELAQRLLTRAALTPFLSVPPPDPPETCYAQAAHLLLDLTRKEPAVHVNDDVIFNSDVGQQITLEDQTYLLLREADILAIVEPEEARV